MEPFLLVSAIFLVYSYQIQGSTAVTVFVQRGEDVTLNLMTADVPESFLFLSWNFNDTFSLITFSSNKPVISGRYTGRVEFSEEKFSVTLKNLQEEDSGVYKAQVTGSEKIGAVAEYDVKVQDPVSPVELKVDSVSNSSDSCNLTVTCSTQDSHISSTFTCDTKTCSEEGGERSQVTTSGVSLRVYMVNDSIICNHSNQVSWTKNMTEIQHFCPRRADPEQLRNHNIVVFIIVVVCILVVILLLAALRYCRKREKNGRLNIENTVYATPEVEATARPLDNSRPSPTTIYSSVKPHTEPVGSTEPTGRTLPDSLYAQVEKPGRS